MNKDLVIIHQFLPKAKCQMNGKEAECLVVSFADGSFNNVTLSWNALKQLVKLKDKQEVE